MTITYRKRGQIEKVREYASQALAIATRLAYLGYIAMARGNMAWVPWRGGNLLEAPKPAPTRPQPFAAGGEPLPCTTLFAPTYLTDIPQQLPAALKYVRTLPL